MKYIKIFKFIFVLALFVGCTDDFEDTNKNPYQISDESLRQDNQHVGAFFPTMLDNLFQDQVAHNLAHESWARHLGTPTPFVGGVNNTTYYIRWNSLWGPTYGNIMAPGRQVIEIAEAEGNDVFVAWAKLIRVEAMSRLSAEFGPIIYTNYGSRDQVIFYDDEPTLYNTWFAELDEIVAAFSANLDFGGMKQFDATYAGDLSKWIKFANTERLRLAMRISKVNPSLAKTQGEKAISHPGGLIATNADNANLFLYDGLYKPWRIANGWGDTRMSATMESVLVGYDDGRISKYFAPATDDSLYPEHPNHPYKGVRNGALIVAKDDRLTFSSINDAFGSVTTRRIITAQETHFLLAEAALRGWAGAGDAGTHYEAGVRASFADWGAGGVDAYLADDTSIPVDYNDPKAEGDINDFFTGSTDPRTMNRFGNITIKWDESADNEKKLERIMTQKWIAAYTNTIEIWCDHRRTGYPKLPYNYKNDSHPDWGVIPADDFLRRMPFTNGERNNNAAGVADATAKLGGPDEIGTRLWWDTGGPNF